MGSQANPDHGYFVDWDDEMEVEAEAEPRERYREGLYCPVRIGDLLVDRYQIVHKLGWGGFSTVWLASDLEEKRAVALKILIPGHGQAECDIEKTIVQAIQDPSRFITHQTAFYLSGVGGTNHMVLVYPVRGPILRTYLRKGLPLTIRMAGARQLLSSLKDLHDVGIVHKDLSLTNVMWHLEPIDHYTTSDLYRRFGRPQKVALTEIPDRPGELVSPMKVPADMVRLPVYIGDFGISFRSTNTPEATVQTPLAFCAPERYHGVTPSFASDVWSYTTIFASLYLDCLAVPSEGISAISRLVSMLGPFPEHWRASYSGGGEPPDWWYDSRLGGPEMPMKTLEGKVDRFRPDISKEERQHFLAVVRKGWCYMPEARATASQLLEDPSFKALMAIYGL